jgi:hypothetical protein
MNGEEGVRAALVVCVLLSIVGAIGSGSAVAKSNTPFRLAQSSTTTSCMMSCNSTAATCQAACVVPGSPPTGAATTGSNATASTSCLMGCSTQQLNCQTNCARVSPSQ